jgi:hypothetical protein
MDDISDDVARVLDYQGWMIVAQPGGVADGSKWPMSSKTGHVPEWAEDISPPLRLVPRDNESNCEGRS